MLCLVATLGPSCAGSARRGQVLPSDARAAPRDTAVVREVTLLEVTDFHGAVVDGGRDRDTQRPWGGAVALAQVVRRERALHPDCTFLLDGGDEMQGTAESNFVFGRSSIAILNALGTDAAAVGNHEFDWGIDTLRARRRDMRYTMLAANVFERSSGRRPDWIRPYAILQRDGVRLGVIGFATPETPRVTVPTNVESLRFDPPEKLLPGLVREVRAQGAQIVVVLCHIGAFQEKDGGVRGDLAELAHSARGVDAFLGGHTHTFVAGRVQGVPVVVAGSSGRALGHVTLRWNGRRVVGSDVELVRAYSDSLQVPERDPIAALADSMRRRVAPFVSRVVGHTSQPLRAEALANLVTDAMRRAVGADVAITNPGGLRRDLEPGNITAGDVFELLPFENALVTVRLTGTQLRRVLESRPDKARLSGLRGKLDPEAPQGQRLSDLQLDGGRRLEPDSTYLVVTNSFIAAGGDGFQGFEDGRDLRNTPLLLRDVVLQAIDTDARAGHDVAVDPEARLATSSKGTARK